MIWVLFVLYAVVSLIFAGVAMDTEAKRPGRDLFLSIVAGFIWPIIVLLGIGHRLGRSLGKTDEKSD